MVKDLDEEIFKKYCKEGWIDIDSRKFEDEILPKFRNGQVIEFWLFGKQFKWNVIEIKWLEIRVWWKYVYKDWKYVLSEDVNTLFPDN